MIDVRVTEVGPAEAGEILTLQRAAFVTEAQLYDEVNLPPLTQTYDELVAELAAAIVVRATAGHRLVGCGRARVDGPTLHIGRLAVAPDRQGEGIGTRLLVALEEAAPGAVERFSLFTGSRSEANIRLYERHGYAVSGHDVLTPTITQVRLEKLRSPQPLPGISF